MPNNTLSTTAFILPLINQPQSLSVALLGVTYNLRTRWSTSQNCWSLDISDADNNLIIGSIPIVTGADLLEQYRYLNIGGGLYVQNTQGPFDQIPTYLDLGGTTQVLFIPYPVQ